MDAGRDRDCQRCRIKSVGDAHGGGVHCDKWTTTNIVGYTVILLPMTDDHSLTISQLVKQALSNNAFLTIL